MMKTILSVIFTLAVCINIAVAQKAKERPNIQRDVESEVSRMKTETAPAGLVPTPADFNDTASFGKNAKFLGSLYAGSVYVYRSCDPQILLDELQLTLAADDYCVAHTTATPMATTTFQNPVWQITIPANSVDNVIYPMLTNTVSFDAYSSLFSPPGNGYPAGFALVRFTPVVTIESTALNDPAAINPTTGLPMNGSFTTNLAGTRLKTFQVRDDE